METAKITFRRNFLGGFFSLSTALIGILLLGVLSIQGSFLQNLRMGFLATGVFILGCTGVLFFMPSYTIIDTQYKKIYRSKGLTLFWLKKIYNFNEIIDVSIHESVNLLIRDTEVGFNQKNKYEILFETKSEKFLINNYKFNKKESYKEVQFLKDTLGLRQEYK